MIPEHKGRETLRQRASFPFSEAGSSGHADSPVSAAIVTMPDDPGGKLVSIRIWSGEAELDEHVSSEFLVQSWQIQVHTTACRNVLLNAAFPSTGASSPKRPHSARLDGEDDGELTTQEPITQQSTFLIR